MVLGGSFCLYIISLLILLDKICSFRILNANYPRCV